MAQELASAPRDLTSTGGLWDGLCRARADHGRWTREGFGPVRSGRGMGEVVSSDRDHRVVSIDGTEIGWRHSGSGGPAVLLHGTADNGTCWALAGRHLSERLTLRSVDRRGRGRSGAGEPYDFEREAEDLAAVVGALDEPPHLIAHSYGAAVALAAASGGLPVRSLVLYEPPITVADHVDSNGLAAECERALAAGEREQVLRIFFRAVGEEPVLDMLKATPEVFDRFLADAHTIPRELRAATRFSSIDVSQITAPTLLILGTGSPEFFGESIDALHAAIPHSEIATFEGQAHLGHVLAPEAFAEIVLGFIASAD